MFSLFILPAFEGGTLDWIKAVGICLTLDLICFVGSTGFLMSL
jgi:hypothetical protein